MKKIFFYFRDFFRQSFSPSFYIALALFTALILVINFSFNLENGIIDRRYYGTFLHFVFFFILNAFVYLVSVLLYTFFNKTGYLLQKKEFILKVLCFLVLITLKRSFYWHKTMIPARLCYQQWLVQIMQNAYGLVVVLLPLFLFYFFCEKNNKNFYGFNNKNFDFKPYFIILLTVAPVIAIASWSPSFTSYYPILKASENTSASLCLQVPEIVTAAFYEFFYLLDFLNTEILFRGFLVLGMLSLWGRNAVPLMVPVYVALHFGKPPLEAVSSAAGGFALGVIIYYTRSVWGGVIIHAGVAFMMDSAAFLQLYLR